jgi:hypothetical protein
MTLTPEVFQPSGGISWLWCPSCGMAVILLDSQK